MHEAYADAGVLAVDRAHAHEQERGDEGGDDDDEEQHDEATDEARQRHADGLRVVAAARRGVLDDDGRVVVGARVAEGEVDVARGYDLDDARRVDVRHLLGGALVDVRRHEGHRVERVEVLRSGNCGVSFLVGFYWGSGSTWGIFFGVLFFGSVLIGNTCLDWFVIYRM